MPENAWDDTAEAHRDVEAKRREDESGHKPDFREGQTAVSFVTLAFVSTRLADRLTTSCRPRRNLAPDPGRNAGAGARPELRAVAPRLLTVAPGSKVVASP